MKVKKIIIIGACDPNCVHKKRYCIRFFRIHIPICKFMNDLLLYIICEIQTRLLKLYYRIIQDYEILFCKEKCEYWCSNPGLHRKRVGYHGENLLIWWFEGKTLFRRSAVKKFQKMSRIFFLQPNLIFFTVEAKNNDVFNVIRKIRKFCRFSSIKLS